jgi:hypothetical protein
MIGCLLSVVFSDVESSLVVDCLSAVAVSCVDIRLNGKMGW